MNSDTENSITHQNFSIKTNTDLNEIISRKELTPLVLTWEAQQERKIAEIAQVIADKPDRKLIMIAGSSASGKTTFSHRLSAHLERLGLTPHPIEVDNYFIDREQSPRDAEGNHNYEALECLDIERLNADLNSLLRGEEIVLPRYNFTEGVREQFGDRLKPNVGDIFVIEGLHCLNDRLTYTIPKACKYKIYLDVLAPLRVTGQIPLSAADMRLFRRIVRDARTRGASAPDTLRRWESVRRGEESNIFPFREQADMSFNSAFPYEISMLKPYVLPMLLNLPASSPEHREIKRLLSILMSVIGTGNQAVPPNSILREFIGEEIRDFNDLSADDICSDD